MPDLINEPSLRAQDARLLDTTMHLNSVSEIQCFYSWKLRMNHHDVDTVLTYGSSLRLSFDTCCS